MTVLTDAIGAPAVHSVLSMHGVMTWEDDDLQVHCQEVVLPPAAIAAKTADCQLKALLGRHGVDFAQMMDGGIINCLQLAVDSASSNFLMVEHLVQTLAPHCLVMFCRCFQHQCGLIISLVTLYF